MPPPVNEPTARGLVIQQMIDMAQTLNRMDSDLDHGNILAAREESAVLRCTVTDLAKALKLA